MVQIKWSAASIQAKTQREQVRRVLQQAKRRQLLVKQRQNLIIKQYWPIWKGWINNLLKPYWMKWLKGITVCYKFTLHQEYSWLHIHVIERFYWGTAAELLCYVNITSNNTGIHLYPLATYIVHVPAKHNFFVSLSSDSLVITWDDIGALLIKFCNIYRNMCRFNALQLVLSCPSERSRRLLFYQR